MEGDTMNEIERFVKEIIQNIRDELTITEITEHDIAVIINKWEKYKFEFFKKYDQT